MKTIFEFNKFDQRDLKFIYQMVEQNNSFSSMTPYLYKTDKDEILIKKIDNLIFHLLINEKKYLISKQSILRMIDSCVEIKNNENRFTYNFFVDDVPPYYKNWFLRLEYNHIMKIAIIPQFIPEIIMDIQEKIEKNIRFEEEFVNIGRKISFSNTKENDYCLTIGELKRPEFYSGPDSSPEPLIVHLSKLEMLAFINFLLVRHH